MSNSIIISMTTIPSKFNRISLTLTTLLNQDVKADAIVVNVPSRYDMRLGGSSISENDLDMFEKKWGPKGVTLNRIKKDYGPGTKLMGLLVPDIEGKFPKGIIDSFDPKCYILLVDDDLLYRSEMIRLFRSHIKRGQALSFAADFVKIPGLNEVMFQSGQGCEGFLIHRPDLRKFKRYYQIIERSRSVLYHDDVYISYYLYLRGRDVVSLRYLLPKPNSLPGHTFDIFYAGGPYKHHQHNLHLLQGRFSRHNLNIQVPKTLHHLNSTGAFSAIRTGKFYALQARLVEEKVHREQQLKASIQFLRNAQRPYLEKLALLARLRIDRSKRRRSGVRRSRALSVPRGDGGRRRAIRNAKRSTQATAPRINSRDGVTNRRRIIPRASRFDTRSIFQKFMMNKYRSRP